MVNPQERDNTAVVEDVNVISRRIRIRLKFITRNVTGVQFIWRLATEQQQSRDNGSMRRQVSYTASGLQLSCRKDITSIRIQIRISDSRAHVVVGGDIEVFGTWFIHSGPSDTSTRRPSLESVFYSRLWENSKCASTVEYWINIVASNHDNWHGTLDLNRNKSRTSTSLFTLFIFIS